MTSSKFKRHFEKHNLEITLRMMSKDNKIITFLDVEHLLNNDSKIKYFKRKCFIKEKRNFFNLCTLYFKDDNQSSQLK